MDQKKRIGEWIVLAAFMAIVALVFQQIATSLTEQGVASGDALFNAALFPKIVVVILLGLGALIAIKLVLVRKDPLKYPIAKADNLQLEEPPEAHSHLRRLQITIVGLLLLYLVMLEPAGFHITTTVVVAAMAWVLGARPFYFPILTGLVLTFTISFLFEGLLKVVLPIGYFEFTPPYGLLGL